MYSYGRKTKRVLNYIQFAENYVLGVGNLFLSHANWPRNGSNRRIWSKIRFFFNKTALADGEGLFSGRFKTFLGKKYLQSFLYQDPQCNYCVGTKNNFSSIKVHKPPVLFARRRSTLVSFSKHHFIKLRQHFHALVFDRMKVFQNYFLSSARKKVNKKKIKNK